MEGSNRFAAFVEKHVKPWQAVVGLAVGVLALATALIAGTTAVFHHFDSGSAPGPLAGAAGDSSDSTWGPKRRVFEEVDRPGISVLNSVVDSQYGDERNFVLVRQTGGEWSNSVDIQPGKSYDVSIFVRNDATDFESKYTYVRTTIPSVIPGDDHEAYATGYASSSSSLPPDVYDRAILTKSSESGVALRYVPDSGKVSIGDQEVQTIQDIESFFGPEGIAVGTSDEDGVPILEAGSSATVTYSFTADWPSFAYSSSVRIAGTNRWQSNIAAQPGDSVEIRLAYANDGSTEQKNVVLKNVLPRELSYVNGSSTLTNGSHPEGLTIGDGINGAGVNIGSYNPGANAFLYYRADVSSSACGELRIDSSAETNNGNKRGQSLVTVADSC
ncbi:DUF11 domain-containing protein [Rhodococcus sp. BP-349]|uniref:DUF11 domain-containing protein n=1 Tax=unclassified Rhodococcus (in: high G+C Gram-positive bacteria) TaxID=192944 RepID=UPI001C9A4820|nr:MULTISPECIES: DUF11 domain-containing protein [unclassified Rhodococcus (in: high G+C Gram-positive bacteria)]MBY6537660.1 DUF11 domain-containing protein [Rhodococcus sp. BP-363]MBY6541997.1 DUF11 domain-containing protein [Rhodococcus sp. BP-369]MBY6561227.1 DUF11 domain-containing protein [Rhodococcus sp. BP-370]MBY6575519.1 DUF11 domain-containing protein [Rhodococcus sp. BP-364]MBY6584820.1 DUF11 domain-containing protein [Rhodococcus sp. BP-358]